MLRIVYILAALLLGAVLVLGKVVSGNRAWLSLGSFTLQPVEFAKLALVLVLAHYFAAKNIEIWRPRHVFVSGALLAGFVGLVVLQPDLGSALVLIGIWFFMIVLSGARIRQVIGLIGLFLILVGIGWQWFFTANQKARLEAFFFPARDPMGSAYSQRQAIIAIGSGGLWGKGFGQGTQAQLGFLPAPRTDFIFAALAEELGFIGVMFVFGAYSVIFARLTMLALAGTNNFVRLFAMGYLGILAVQIVINVGMNLGFLPVIGIPLPFVSYGGSNLLMLAIGLGMTNSMRFRM
jgi:rod shape determining protein RodA